MLINLTELFSSNGKENTYTCDIDMEALHTKEEDYPVVSKLPVKLRIRNLGDRKLLVQGNAELTLQIPCARCLEPVDCPFKLELDEELDMSKTEADHVQELDEQPYVSGYNLDVDRLLSNELLLNLPIRVLCREDCKGICNRCGANLNHTKCSCDTSSPDPRMSAIQDIFQKFKEV
ncbi:MAG: DUF177 domain-containing protein [Lachnospiraceae bacterium]|nr:DUF177 domain-containing protein [Lachnospiraceae bacterium]